MQEASMDASIALGEKRQTFDSRDEPPEHNKRPAVGIDQPAPHLPPEPAAGAQTLLAWGAMNALLAMELEDEEESLASTSEPRIVEPDGIRSRTVSLLDMGGIRRLRSESGRRRICATLEKAPGFSTSKLFLDVRSTFRYECGYS